MKTYCQRICGLFVMIAEVNFSGKTKVYQIPGQRTYRDAISVLINTIKADNKDFIYTEYPMQLPVEKQLSFNF